MWMVVKIKEMTEKPSKFPKRFTKIFFEKLNGQIYGIFWSELNVYENVFMDFGIFVRRMQYALNPSLFLYFRTFRLT